MCGTGIATSTVATQKLKQFLENKGIEAQVEQAKVMEIGPKAEQFDLIVATTQVSSDVKTPVVNAVPLLTGVGLDQFYEKVEKALTEK